MKIKLETIIGVVAICLYKLLIDVNYVHIIEPIYSYASTNPNHNVWMYIMSWLITPVMSVLAANLFHDKHPLSSNVIFTLFLVSYVPTMSIIQYHSTSLLFILLFNVYWFFIFLYNKLIPSFRLITITPKSGMIVSKALFFIFAAVIVFVSGVYTNFRLNFNLYNVYELRAEASSWNIPTILAYMLSAAAKVLPLFFIVYMKEKNKLFSLLIIVLTFLNFSIAGHKTIIFTFLLAVFGYYFFKINRIKLYAWGLATLSFVALLEYKILDTFHASGLIIRRVLFFPAIISLEYFDYFSAHGPDYFRQSFLRHLGLQSPYDKSIAHTIGDAMGYPGMSANNGLFSDAYANLGALGMLVMPLFLVLFLRFMDTCTKGLDFRLLFVVIVMTTITLLSSFLFTSIITHGLLITAILLLFIKEKVKNDAKQG